MKPNIYIIFFLLFSCHLFAQNGTDNIKRSNYEGRHFFIGFMQNETQIDSRTGLALKIYITSNSNAKIDVDVPGYGLTKYVIRKDSVLSLLINQALEMYRSEEVLKQSIEITSDVPVSVCAFSSQAYTSDGYSAIPVSHWGTEYVCMSYYNDQYQTSANMDPIDSISNAHPRQSEFMVIAAYDSTEITFQPKVVTEKGKQYFRTYTITLNKGDCYLVKSIISPKGTADLSGTIVNSTKPVGFLSGHVRTAVPYSLSYYWDSKNHLVEMLMPTSAWGKRFITVPLGLGPQGDLIRLTNIKPNTKVTMMTNSGDAKYYDLTLPGSVEEYIFLNEPAVWVADQPIQICQYVAHAGTPDDDQFYDPAMVTVPPVEQYVSRILFQVPGDLVNALVPPQFTSHHCMMIIDTMALPSFRIDSVLVSLSYNMRPNKITGTPFVYGYFNLKPGKHEFSCDQGSFDGIMYGQGLQDAYALILGTSLTNPFESDTIPPEITVNERCGKIQGYVHDILDKNFTGIDYAVVDQNLTVNYRWTMSNLNDTATTMNFTAEPIDVTKDGTFVIYIWDKNGNGSKYRFDYEGIQVTLPSFLEFSNVIWVDSSCYTFVVKNLGQDSLFIDTVGLKGNDPRVRYSSDKEFPFYLFNYDSITIKVCFDPRGDTSAMTSELIFGFDCNRYFKIPITGTVRSMAYDALGHDFKKVRIHDTLCDFALIVNNGNIDLHLDSLIILKPSAPFIIDTAGKFPVKLKPGDTLVIPVCFSPDSLFSYRITCTAVNSNNYNRNDLKYLPFLLLGTGIAPDVRSIVIDWKERRIGTSNDTTFNIVNYGSDTCNISFSELSGSSEVFSDTNALKLSRKLLAPDSIKIAMSFKPADTLAFSAIAKYGIDWKWHDTVNLTLLGKGTLPVIETRDVDMGFTQINKIKNKIAPIVFSKGNEKLTIDSIRYFSGDGSVFAFPALTSNGYILPIGDSLLQQISFSPVKTGMYEATYAVYHDAMPNYARTVSYFKIKGLAVPSDTLNAELDINGSAPYISCNTKQVFAEIKNTGNVTFDITDLQLSASGLTANWSNPLSLPDSVRKGNSAIFPIDVFLRNQSSGNINVTAIINDTLKLESKINVTPTAYPLIIGNYGVIRGKPGDTIKVKFSGKFPNKTEIPVDLKFIFHLKQKNLLLTIKNTYFTVLGITTKKNYSLFCVQEPEKIVLTPESTVEIESDSSEWEFELTFLVLLSDELTDTVNLEALADDCFIDSGEPGKLEIEGVCIQSFRTIKLIENYVDMTISPFPASDYLILNIFLGQDDNISVKIFDKVGKNCYNYKNLNLKKGNHSLKFEFDDLTEGLYLLQVQTSGDLKRKIFIISK